MHALKIHTISLGCPKNQVDTEWMLGSFGPGLVTVLCPQEADVVLINTCGFIEPAVSESLQTIVDTAQEIRLCQPRPLLVVTGCLVNRYAQDLLKELPEVDLFLEIAQQHELSIRVRELLTQQQPKKTTWPDPGTKTRLLTTAPSFAYLKIAEGCDNHCRFCTIPAIRGPLQSRSLAAIVDDAKACLDQGRRELILVAQDVTAYGRDLGTSLPTLLEKLAPLPGLSWLRLMYLYPSGLDRALLRFLADLGAPVLPYFDIPFQHAHPDILAAMGRPFQRDPRQTVDRIRQFFPQAALRTTCIVGYPGETETQFQALEDFVRQTRFTHLGVFPYSAEDGSQAATLPHQVPAALKEERYARIMRVQAEISTELLKDYEQQELEILVDAPHEEWPGLFQGRAWFQAPEVDGITYVSGQGVTPGQLVRAVVDEAKTYDLVALV